MARLLLAVALLAAGASPSGAASLEALARDMRVTLLDGQPAPALTLSDLRGKPVSLSDYKGRVVLLYFWASW